VQLLGHELGQLSRDGLRSMRRHMQFVLQNPYSSLHPRMTVAQTLAEPLRVHRCVPAESVTARVAELMTLVGLDPAMASRYPHEFSGGQRQRIVIARALAVSPDFVVCDEPVSALDVSMQAQIINLLLDLQERLGLSYLFIAHDLAVVRSIATDVAVMYAGALVEQAPKRVLYSAPKHPYTQALLDAVPRPDPDRVRSAALGGEVPSILNPLPGCAFAARCPHVMDVCRQDRPAPRPTGEGHVVACHLY
jgi:oligopeptide/dipeptide ABC transporter ATP-binding protein